MKSVEAIKILHGCDLEGRILFHSRELGTLFGESGDTLRSTIKRLAADGILERVAHDSYLYLLFHPNGCDVLGHIATFPAPRRGHLRKPRVRGIAVGLHLANPARAHLMRDHGRRRHRRYPIRCHRVYPHGR